ncbi:MAG TPA: glucosaminidase domain-containing protein [Gammaproteobacteria bacterium]
MRLDRIKNSLAPFSAHLQVDSVSDLLVLLCASGALAFAMCLPLVAGYQLPDLRPLATNERKDEFFALLDPIVEKISAEIAGQRAFVDAIADDIAAGNELSWIDQIRLLALAEYYEVTLHEADLETEVIPLLQRRIDIVPRSLILIQAAKESGWGTSRFALQGNNLFGQRCYASGCGLEPAGVDDPNFNVATFSSVDESVASYVRNLNTHPQYLEFRRKRQALRAEERSLSGTVLADSLDDYSERGDDYVEEIKDMITQNELEQVD